VRPATGHVEEVTRRVTDPASLHIRFPCSGPHSLQNQPRSRFGFRWRLNPFPRAPQLARHFPSGMSASPHAFGLAPISMHFLFQTLS
jgi:hypothetical protein